LGEVANYQGNVSYRLLDALGVSTPYTVYFEVAEANDITDIVTAVNTLGAFVDAASGSQITEQSVKITNITLPGGYKAAPVAGSRNNQIGNFTFEQAGVKYVYTTALPALRDTLIVNEEIDNTAAAVTNLTGELVTPSGVLSWTSQGVRDLTAWLSDFISFRKHRKLNKQKSQEIAP
jgi:hypothetical protein